MNAEHETKSPLDRTGKLAWITGASSGIGRALALRLVRDGWRVAASARSVEALDDLVREASDRIVSYPLDITDPDAVMAVPQAITSAMGPIDLAVLCAGTYARDSASNFDSRQLASMVELNIMGTAYCLEAMIGNMVGRGTGHIAVVSSVSGYVGLPGAAHYGATKAALINMCEALYPELEAKGVRLSLVNPGFVETPLTARNDFPMPFLITADEAADHIARRLSAGRFEIAFPWKMVLSLKILRLLPHRLRFALTRRMLRKD